MTDIMDTENTENVDSEEIAEKTFTAKGLAKAVVKSSVKFVIAGVITSVLPEPVTKIHKVKTLVGTYVVSDMVARSSGTYVDEKIQEWKNDIHELRTAIKKIEESMKAEQDTPESSTP